jgi:hypothetical protein
LCPFHGLIIVTRFKKGPFHIPLGLILCGQNELAPGQKHLSSRQP